MQTPPEKHQISEPKIARNGYRNKLLTTAPLISRGLNQEEYRLLCTSPIIPLRERTYFRVIYETELRPQEVLFLEIERLNKETGELVAVQTKGKFNRWTGERYQLPRHVIVTPNTLLMLKTLISNRKKGYIFEGRDGAPISKRYMQAQIDKYARLLSIQQLRRYGQSEKNPEDTRELPLVTLMALRKAGERHVDANGGDPSLSAQAAGHTMRTKIKHYQGEQDWETVHKSYREHHPAFVEGW